MNTFCLKYYHHWEEGVTSCQCSKGRIRTLDEFFCDVIYVIIALMVSYFVYCSCLTDNQTSPFVNQWPNFHCPSCAFVECIFIPVSDLKALTFINPWVKQADQLTNRIANSGCPPQL